MYQVHVHLKVCLNSHDHIVLSTSRTNVQLTEPRFESWSWNYHRWNELLLTLKSTCISMSVIFRLIIVYIYCLFLNRSENEAQ